MIRAFPRQLTWVFSHRIGFAWNEWRPLTN
jgi:hypothetical protein